jgi:apolipoprotein N-acyltransferase
LTFGRRLGLSAISGALLALAFPKAGFAAVAFIATSPLLLALHGASRRQGFLLGQVTGTVQGFLLLSWVADVLQQFGGASAITAFFLTFLLALAFGLFLGAFGLLQANAGLGFPRSSLLFAPFLFVACEYLREHLLFGFPWCLLGYSQAEFSELIQIASFTAVHGVSFLLVASSAGLAHLVVSRNPVDRRLGITIPALLVSGALAFGHGRLQKPLSPEGRLSVGVVQASIPQDQKWDEGLLQSNIERHLTLSREASRRGARLVVWPESAVGYELDLYPEVKEQIADFTSKESVFLLTGNDDRERGPSGEARSYVGAKLITPAGDIILRYHKMRLVPFGEYLPFASWLRALPVRQLVQSVSAFTPGTKAVTAEVQGVQVGAFICYEAIFPSLVRRFPEAGAQVLVNLTNDGWYGTSAAPYQHYAMARFRAVENHRFLVRAANTGISAIIDPLGREIARTDLMEASVLVGEVRGLSELTFYARHGDVFAWLVVAIAALSSAAAAFLGSARSHRLPVHQSEPASHGGQENH